MANKIVKLTERKRIVNGIQIEDFLKSYGFYNVVKDYEEHDDFTIVGYVYAITPFLKPSTPRVEFEVDEDTNGFIDGYIYPNGDKGYNIDLKFMEDLEYFVKNAKLTESRKSMKENRFDDIIQCVETLLLDPRVLKSIEGYEKEYTELAYMLAERLDPSDFAMDEDSLAREIEDMLIRGKIKITESKKSTSKTLKESELTLNNLYYMVHDGIATDITWTPLKELQKLNLFLVKEIMKKNKFVGALFEDEDKNKYVILTSASPNLYPLTTYCYNNDRYYMNESKKSTSKTLKEGIDVKIVYADDTPSEYIDDVTHNDILDIIEESPEVYKIFDVSGSKKKLVWSDEYGFERAYESKKSLRKSLKEGINDELIATSSDGETALYLSDERQANHGKDPHYEFKLGENGYFTRYIRCDDERCENVVLDWIKEFDLDISKSEISKIIKLHESKKFTRKSMKESTDESFSLYDLNKHDPFVKEWVKNINKELKDVSIESIGDNEIIFRVWFDESIDLDIFDDIATDCMPRTLIEFMSDMNIDFGYQFVYADDKFTENDFVFIRFVAW